jgi:predicted  nucleic acid-binding Zn-ribbon protein
MTEVLHALVKSVNETSAELREHRQEFREERQRLREEMREERREFREDMRMQRAALIAILDQLRGGGPGTAPAT